MDTVLIAGIDSVVGSNIAAFFSDHFRTVGLSFSQPVEVEGCETRQVSANEEETARNWVATVRPNYVIHCGTAARPAWQNIDRPFSKTQTISSTQIWATAAKDFDAQFTLISSDAVFTGPWMFHDEESTCHCQSSPAQTIREIERSVQECCPSALIVRTHAYGWTPESLGTGWIEETLDQLEAEVEPRHDCMPHATPILATDLAEILVSAWNEKLHGLFHIAGAERVNPLRFAKCLSEQFDLPTPRYRKTSSLSQPPTGFGRGETSLRTSRIRGALGIGMPTLSDGLKQLCEQSANGFRDRIRGSAKPVRNKVA